MNKQEFLDALRNRLGDLPQVDVEERISFYSEMLDDRMEEGISEKEAIDEIGAVDRIASQIVAEMSVSAPVTENVTSKRNMRAWEIVLLVLGSPLWLSLLAAFFAVALAVYVTVWSVVIAVWSVEVALAACAIGGLLSPILYISQGNLPGMVAVFGAGVCCVGLAILLFFGCVAASKGILWVTKKLTLWIRSIFARKGNA